MFPRRTFNANVNRWNETVRSAAVLGKNIWGAWPLIIWEATTARRQVLLTYM